MNQSKPASKSISLSPETIEAYRRDGFVKVENIITKEEAAFFHAEALKIATANVDESGGKDAYRRTLNQTVNVWPENEILRQLTLHPNVAQAAKELAGVPLRLWHDHVLAKDPHNGAQTEWHQDQPYWPHNNSKNPISCWIALCDVPAHKGSMSFIPRQQHRDDLSMQILSDDRSLFSLAPELEYEPKVTVPLRAGDCTFHHGRCPHMANANSTDDYRIAHVIIFIDRDTIFDPTIEGHATGHLMTDPLNLKPGDPITGDLFPEI